MKIFEEKIINKILYNKFYFNILRLVNSDIKNIQNINIFHLFYFI
jgi:hypothetical protein